MNFNDKSSIRIEMGKMKINICASTMLITTIILLILTDISILINMEFVRPIFTFFMFFLMPGLLILDIIGYYSRDIFKMLLFAISLSISFKYFIGLILNYSFVSIGFAKPLTLYPIVFSLSFSMLLLSFIAYYRKQNQCYIYEINVKKSVNNKLISPLLLSILFPFLGIIGIYYMNLTKSNIILMILFSLIIVWFIVVTAFSKKTIDITYPIGILMISSSILLIGALDGNFLKPGDIEGEFESLKIILSNSVWTSQVGNNRLLASLSVSLLPAIDQILLGIDKLYIYKLIYPILISFIPLGCYILYKIYLPPVHASLSAFFYIAQLAYMYSLITQMRIGIALLFFISFFILYFDKNSSVARSILLIIFSLSLVVSYYALPVIFLFIAISVYTISNIISKISAEKKFPHININIILISFIAIFIWWEQLTWRAFTLYVKYFRDAFLSLTTPTTYAPTSDFQTMTSLYDKTIPEIITLSVNYIFLIIMAVSVIVLIIQYMKNDERKLFDIPYLISMTAVFAIIASFVIMPSLERNYTIYRMYLIILVILSPAIVVLIDSIPSRFNFKKIILTILTFLLIIQFMCSTFYLHQLMGVPYSEFLSKDSERYLAYHIDDSDVNAAIWLKNHIYDQEIKVLTDVRGGAGKGLFAYAYEGSAVTGSDTSLAERLRLLDKENTLINNFILFRRSNIEGGLIIDKTSWKPNLKLSDYEIVINSNQLIYNGGPRIYFAN